MANIFHFHRARSSSSGSVNHSLANVENMITFKCKENGSYGGQLQIQNVAGRLPIIFKIRTTSPEKYFVTPPIAAIAAGGTAKVIITAHPGVSSEAIMKDHFRVQVCILPNEAFKVGDGSSNDSLASSIFTNTDFERLNATFKRLISLSATGVENFKVPVSVEPPTTSPVPEEKCLSMSAKEFNSLEKRITHSLSTKLARDLDKMRFLLCILLCILILLLIISLRQLFYCYYSNEQVLPVEEPGCDRPRKNQTGLFKRFIYALSGGYKEPV